MKCTKKEMRETAISLFKEYGYDATTVNQICEACKVTKGSFYNYYKSKKEILLDFYDDKITNYPELMARLIKEKSYKEQLWKVLEFSIDATIDLGANLLYHMMIADMEQGAKLFNANLADLEDTAPEYVSVIRNLISEAQKANEIQNPGAPDRLWYVYVNGLLGVAMHWSSSGGEYDEKKALRNLFDIVFF